VHAKCYSWDVIDMWTTYDEHLGNDMKDNTLFLSVVENNMLMNIQCKH
jgi:hypothetical protein